LIVFGVPGEPNRARFSFVSLAAPSMGQLKKFCMMKGISKCIGECKMTKVRFHGPIAGFSGAMDEMVFADTKKKNRTVAYMKKHYPPTQAQIDHRARFAECAHRAEAALTDPATYAFYAAIAEERDSTPHAVAFTDFMVLPSFKPLNFSKYQGRVGDKIAIRAEDDLGLAEVNVSIVAQDGTPIEQGKATEDGVRTGIWTYVATQPVALGADIFIEVTGVDHAGNEAQITENPTVGAEA
jgi:hypothetical protein